MFVPVGMSLGVAVFVRRSSAEVPSSAGKILCKWWVVGLLQGSK